MPFIKTPDYPLSTAVELLWFCKSDDVNSKVTTFPVLNEGLFIDFSQSYKTVDFNGKPIISNKTIWFTGMQTKPMQTEIKGSHEQYGILFKPGGCYRLFGVPASEFADRTIDATDAFGKQFDIIIDTVIKEINPLSKLSAIENFLLKKIEQRDVNPYLQNVISALNDNGLRNGGIKKLIAEINQSTKSFIANFKKVYGITPKKFCQMKLINNSLSDIASNPSTSLTQIGLNNGFYDQSHFIKHFTSFLNVTPKQYKTYILEGKVTREYPNFMEHIG